MLALAIIWVLGGVWCQFYFLALPRYSHLCLLHVHSTHTVHCNCNRIYRYRYSMDSYSQGRVRVHYIVPRPMCPGRQDRHIYVQIHIQRYRLLQLYVYIIGGSKVQWKSACTCRVSFVVVGLRADIKILKKKKLRKIHGSFCHCAQGQGAARIFYLHLLCAYFRSAAKTD